MSAANRSTCRWLPEWRTIWLVVHPDEGTVPCTDEDIARYELDTMEESSGVKGEIVGPFRLQDMAASDPPPVMVVCPLCWNRLPCAFCGKRQAEFDADEGGEK